MNETGQKKQNIFAKSGVRWGLGYLFILLCGVGLVYYWRVIYGFSYFTPAFATFLVCAFFSAMYLVVFLCAHFVRQNLPVKAALLIFFAGLCFAAANPPLQAPDETMHFVRSYALGSGDFSFDQNKDYPADVDALVEAFPGFYNSQLIQTEKASMMRGYERYYDILSGREQPAPNATTLTQQFLYYLPQAAGVAAGRLLGADALVCMYLARVVNLAVYAALCGMAVYCASRFVPLLIALMASPVALFISASCSPDALFLGASWLFIGVCLSAWVSPRRLAALAGSFVLMYCTKPTAAALLPLLLLLDFRGSCLPLPRSKGWGEKKRLAVQIALTAAGCLALGWLCSQLLGAYTAFASNYGRVDYAIPGIDGAAQLRFILQNPVRYAAVFLYTLYRDKANLFSGGAFGWMDMVLPFVNYFTPMVWLFAAGLCAREAAREKTWKLWVIGLCGALMYAATYTGMYLTSTPVSLPEINGVQTRYLMAGFFALFVTAAALLGRTMALQDTQRVRPQKTPPAWRMLHISYCFAVVSAILLFQNYYIGETLAA